MITTTPEIAQRAKPRGMDEIAEEAKAELEGDTEDKLEDADGVSVMSEVLERAIAK